MHSNLYNPNKVAPPEMALLRRSILEDGWTSAIVVRTDYEIVDGFHRWTVSGEPEIAALTGGLVPVAFLRDDVDKAHQVMSTIRHNRARGTHAVIKMADIVADLRAEGIEPDEMQHRLGMEDEEIDRLTDRGNMLKRGSRATFDQAWSPDEKDPTWLPPNKTRPGSEEQQAATEPADSTSFNGLHSTTVLRPPSKRRSKKGRSLTVEASEP